MSKRSPRKGAILGFGQVAERGHLPAWLRSRDFSIVAVAESRRERREAAAKLLPNARVYGDFQDLLRSEDSLDFVDIATPPTLHAPQCLSALERGLHVLCEKPLALERGQFDRLRSAARLADRALFTVHNWKHAPLFQKLEGLLREGAIGGVRHAELHTLRTRPAATAFSRPEPASAHRRGRRESNWRTDVRLSGGGILVDHGWHSFYLLTWLLQARPFSSSGHLRLAEGSRTDEEAACLVRYPSATAVVFLTWKAARRSHWGVFYGDKGRIEIGDERLVLAPDGNPAQTFLFSEPLSHGSAHPDWFGAMLADFEYSLSDKEYRENNLGEAAACVSIIEGLYRGIRPREGSSAPAEGIGTP